jgi:ubiquinone/menaquinone biosynthesis C-methylase UbiE
MKADVDRNAYKQQEVKFVEWSIDVSSEDYDIKQILESLRDSGNRETAVLDIGGGIGSVGVVLADNIDRTQVDVIDNSVLAEQNFMTHERVKLIFGNFLNMAESKQYDVIIFRTVLHHIIGATSEATYGLQDQAIAKAGRLLLQGGKVFVVENFYESFFSDDVTGELIFQLTRLKLFSNIFRRLGANTAGEGVRFRSFNSWSELFSRNALTASGKMSRQQRTMPLWQSIPFVCKDRYQAVVEFQQSDRAQ